VRRLKKGLVCDSLEKVKKNMKKICFFFVKMIEGRQRELGYGENECNV